MEEREEGRLGTQKEAEPKHLATELWAGNGGRGSSQGPLVGGV